MPTRTSYAKYPSGRHDRERQCRLWQRDYRWHRRRPHDVSALPMGEPRRCQVLYWLPPTISTAVPSVSDVECSRQPILQACGTLLLTAESSQPVPRSAPSPSYTPRYIVIKVRSTSSLVMALWPCSVRHSCMQTTLCVPCTQLWASRRLAGLSQGGAGALGVPVQMRLGVNTGLVVVGRIGDDVRVDYTAQGAPQTWRHGCNRWRRQGQSGWARRRIASPVRRSSGRSWDCRRGRRMQCQSMPCAVHARSCRFEVEVQRGLTRFVGPIRNSNSSWRRGSRRSKGRAGWCRW